MKFSEVDLNRLKT